MIRNLNNLLAHSARKHPAKTAIVFGSKKITYHNLDETTNRVAAGLIHLGIKPGDKVALYLDNCPEFVISYFAILKAGATVVPVNFMFKMEEVKFILEDSGAVCLITGPANAEMARELRLRIDSLRYLITTSRAKETIPDLSHIKRDKIDAVHAINPEPDALAVVLYTSGTTGKPKGAMLTHYNLVSNALDCSHTLKITKGDAFICILPLFHSFAATVCMNLPLLTGSKIVIMKSIKPFKRVIRAIRKNRVTLFVGIPSMYTVLKNMKLPKFFPSPLLKLFNPVRLCISGAASLPVETFKTFEQKFRIPLIEGYGLTEAAPVVTLNPIKGLRKPGSIGLRMCDRIDLRVVDEHGKDIPAGSEKAGELLVKGPNVMKGYLNHPQDTAEALKNGWLHTGDMVTIDKQGYVYIAGRKKEMINVRGLNVYPREIEEVLYQNPKIKEAAVVGIADEHKGEVPKGFVVLKEGESATNAELLHYLRERLAAFKVPKTIEFRQSLPKNSTGKILKRLLQEEENARKKETSAVA